jgi:hypothetical protein
MKRSYLLACVLIVLGTSTGFDADLRDVLASPEKYKGREVDLIGIARVPGYFYLFADPDAAADTNLSKALLIRKNNFGGIEYRDLDRQWVRITGVMSSEPRRGWDPGEGVLLSRAELLTDRPAPRIEDWTVLGVFQNTTSEPLAINLLPRSDAGRTTFFLRPYEADKTIINEGQAVVFQLKGSDSVPLDKREEGKQTASCEITFRQLLPDYQYSPQGSDKRTLYFRIFSDRIQLVPASEARDWKIVERKNQP